MYNIYWKYYIIHSGHALQSDREPPGADICTRPANWCIHINIYYIHTLFDIFFSAPLFAYILS